MMHIRIALVTAIVTLGISACAQVGNSPQIMPFAAPRALTAVSTAAAGYTIRDLGTLQGDNASFAGGHLNLGGGLNNLGQAAGSSSNPTAAIATLFSNGRVTNLNTLRFSVSLANAINGAGQIAGWGYFDSDPSFHPHAFLYNNGSMRDISAPSRFPAGEVAYGINSSGRVVGQGYLSDGSYHAFLYSGGRTSDLGAATYVAYAINDSGEIIGAATDGGSFIYSNGKITNIALGARAMNNNGQIVGNGGPGASHAVLYSNGVQTDLGAFPGAVSTLAIGINITGQIVGTAIFPVTCYCHPPKPGKHVGLIFRNGGQVDLNTLIPSNSGFTITDALGINDSGQIVADATNTSGYTHAVLLTPK